MDKQVERILLFTYKTYVCSKHLESKLLTCWYYTLVKIYKMYPPNAVTPAGGMAIRLVLLITTSLLDRRRSLYNIEIY